MILRYIEVHMEQEAERREQSYQGRSKPRSVKTSITGLLALICRLLFYRPVWTEENQRRKNVRFIYVRFSAWHFAGSDLLWAGLVMRLCLALQESFGKLQLGLYRVTQHNEEDEVRKKVIENTSSEWRSKKFCCFPLWSLVLALLLAALIVLVFLVKYGFPEVPEAPELDGLGSGNGTGEEGQSEAQRGAGVLEGLTFAVFGVPAAAAIRFIFQMGKNLIFNQDLNVRNALDNERVSGQLGFMNEVRKEMWLLSRFIQFMEVFEQRRIRVVLEITNLDRCAPKKIVGVLDAISILLSDEESPFISLLAVNPEVLVQQVHIVLPVNPEVLVQQVHIVPSVNPEVLVQQVHIVLSVNPEVLVQQVHIVLPVNPEVLVQQVHIVLSVNPEVLVQQVHIVLPVNPEVLVQQVHIVLSVNPEVLVQQVHIVLSVNPDVLVQQVHIVLSVNPEVLVQQVHIVLPVNPEVLVQQVHIVPSVNPEVLVQQVHIVTSVNPEVLVQQVHIVLPVNPEVLVQQVHIVPSVNPEVLVQQVHIVLPVNPDVLVQQVHIVLPVNPEVLVQQVHIVPSVNPEVLVQQVHIVPSVNPEVLVQQVHIVTSVNPDVLVQQVHIVLSVNPDVLVQQVHIVLSVNPDVLVQQVHIVTSVNPDVLVQQVHIVVPVNPEVLVQQVHIVPSVNPEVLVQQVNYADGCFSQEDRAYAFLNRIVTLAFTIPPLCHTSKHKVFYNIVSGQSEITEEVKGHGSKGIELRELDLGIPKSSLPWIESTSQTKEMSSFLKEASIPLIDNNHIKAAQVAFALSEDEVDKAIESALESILSSNRGNLHHYISDDTMSMRRVINSIRVTVVLMEALKTELPLPENIAAWVVLANHWPCRLSWILQCLEDEQQRAEIDDAVGTATLVDESKTLWEVFSDSRMELHMMREEIEDLLEQDGDPEMFEMFLKVHFQFRVRDAERLNLTTVNLDHSIRRQLARIRGTTRLKNSGWGRNLAPLNIRTVINMTSEDVCKALARMNLPKKYADIVRSNDLTGQALVFGDPDDLKQLLQMTFGEWTTFRLHFLGIGGRPQGGGPKATSLNLNPKQLTNQQSKQPQFGPHSHGSTLNLYFS
ncbi:uncharacterized protein LOC115179489 isoform X2 [Salmo trutta]|nr:uncharacterized protein LOC115179489 isoform X2 [Salmo trutta]